MTRILDRIDDWLTRLDRALADGRRWPMILFVAALILKVIYVWQSADALNIRVPIMDSRYYDEMARDIVHGHILQHDAFFMGPLYPYVLALIYATLGRDFMVVRLLQAAGGALTVTLVFLIGRRLFRPSAALLGAVLLALYGAMTFYETQILMEWLGTLLNVTAIYVLVRGGDAPSVRRSAAAGAVLGLSALARASILLFAAVVAVWLLWTRPRRAGRKRMAAFAGALVIVILPATIHNYIATHDFVPVTSNAGVNLYVGNGREANGTFLPIRDVDLIDDVTTREYVERITGRQMTPTDVSLFWIERTLDDVRKDPGRALGLLGLKTALFFNGYEVPQIESFDVEQEHYVWLHVLFVHLWPIMVLGLFGMAVAAKSWRPRFLLYGYVLAYAASIIIFFVTGRYRCQMTPILCLFAGHALVTLPHYARRFRPAAASAVALTALAIACNPALFVIDPNMIQFREQVRRGRRLGTLNKCAAAVREIDKAIAIYPRASEGYVQRAIIYKGCGNDFKAIEDYNRSLQIDPAQPSVHYDLAQALRRVNLREEAIKEYGLAARFDPRMVQAYNNMGITFREMHQYEDAVKAFRKVIEVAPTYEKAYNNLGASYAEMGKMDEAVATFQETTRRFPDYANGFKNLAMAYAAQKRPRPALDAMRRYVELEPGDAQAREIVRKLEIAAEADTTGAP